ILTGSPIIDRITSLHACIGTLGALIHRNVTGEGQVVDVSLLDTGVTLMEIPISHHLGTGADPEDYYGGVYKAKDGYVIISVGSRALWARLFKGMGRPDLAEDPQYLRGSVSKEAQEKRLTLLREWTASRPVAEITETLVEAEVPVGPVQTVAQMARDPHLREREMMVEVPNEDGSGTIMAPGLSIKFSKTKGSVGKVPAPGEHNREILGDLLEFGDEKLGELRAEGVI
ncbi:MAG: CoA transferase, partial [Dehalococcoidia bacterium]